MCAIMVTILTSVMATGCVDLVNTDSIYEGPITTGQVDKSRTLVLEHQAEVYQAPASEDGRCYYFSSSIGDDANDGLSPDRPKRSFDALQTKEISPGPGDRLLLRRGDTFSWTLWRKAVMYLPPGTSGSEENPIEITSYGDAALERPLISPTASWIDYDKQYGIFIDEGSFIHIHDIDFEKGKAGIFLYSATPARGSSPQAVHHIEIHDCTFTDIAMAGQEHYHYESSIGEWTPKINNNGYGLFWSAGVFIGTDMGAVPYGLYAHHIHVHDVIFTNCDVGVGNAAYWLGSSLPIVEDLVITSVQADGCLQGGFMLNNASGVLIDDFHLTSGGGYSASGICGAFFQYVQDAVVRNSSIDKVVRGTYLKDGVLHSCHDGVGFDLEGGNRRILIQDSSFSGNAGAGIMICNTDPVGDGGGTRTPNSDIFIINTSLLDNCSDPDTNDYGLARKSNRDILSWQPDASGYIENLKVRFATDGSGVPISDLPLSELMAGFELYGPIWIVD